MEVPAASLGVWRLPRLRLYVQERAECMTPHAREGPQSLTHAFLDHAHDRWFW